MSAPPVNYKPTSTVTWNLAFESMWIHVRTMRRLEGFWKHHKTGLKKRVDL